MKLAGLWTVGLVLACALVFILGAAEEIVGGWRESAARRKAA